MAKQMSHTDPNTGVASPEAVWVPLVFNLNAAGPDARIEFLAYKDAATAGAAVAFALGLSDGTGKLSPLATKAYTLTREQFAAFALAAVTGKSLVAALSGPAYELAMTTFDTPDQSDPAKLVSFFAGAKDVSIT